MSSGRVVVCFDYEGRWGMPFAAQYDLATGTRRILEVLAAHQLRAVFFVVGALALERPDLVQAIAAGGHEIALHGFRHEDLGQLPDAELTLFGEELGRAAVAVEELTGTRPVGFRAPYLLAPRFFHAGVYEVLATLGFRWVSNLEVRHVVELLRPDRIRSDAPWRLVESRPQLLEGVLAQALLAALNPRILRGDGIRPPLKSTLRWLLTGFPPLYRGRLLELPLYSPMDCDLLGLPDPSAPTSAGLLRFADFALRERLSHSGPLTLLTFHDWIAATANRLALLEGVLSFIGERGFEVTTVERSWTDIAQLAVTGVRQ